MVGTMTSMRTAAGAVGVALPLVAVLACASTSGSDAAPVADAAVGNDARGPRPDAGTDDWTPVPPPSVPEGWVHYGDYDKSCGFYIPSERRYLPKGIEWEPCETQIGDAGAPGPPGMVCRRMVTDWEPAEDGQHTIGNVPTAVGLDGKLRMRVRRFVRKDILDLVADVDGGGVHQAILMTGKCLTIQPSLSRTHVIYGIIDDYKYTGGAGGAIGGPIDQLRPTVYRPYGYKSGETIFPSFRAGDGLFVEDHNLDKVLAFDGGNEIASLPNQPEDYGTSYTGYQFSGQDLFFESDSSARVTTKVWNATGGIRTLLGAGNDNTRSTIGLGTDGVDMVWLEASERVGSSQIYAKQETWTAKYTTDPAVANATKRRVRATTIEYGNVYVVGCGYAAVYASMGSPWGQAGFRLIRLSDGYSWNVVDNSKEQMLSWAVREPLAVTCEDVFAVGAKKGHYELLRIRIDSLGPGTPPT